MSIKVHPKSKWSAADFVRIIIQDKHIKLSKYPKATLRTCFKVNRRDRRSFDITAPSKLFLPRDIVKSVNIWYNVIELASRKNHWYITTGEWLNKGTVRAHANDKAFWKKVTASPQSSSKTPTKPAPAPKKELDFTKDRLPKAVGGSAGKINILKKGSVITQNALQTGPIVTLALKTAVAGVCVPPKAWAKDGMQYYDEGGRGIIVIPIKSADSSIKSLLKIARNRWCHTILHELIHAGIAENKRNWTGHCFRAFFKLDQFFRSGESKQSCCDEIRERFKGPKMIRSLKLHGCATSRHRLNLNPEQLFKN